VFPLPGGAWGFVIGDVCGKGAAAAALTGLARHTVRAAAVYEPGAAGVLRALHEAVLAEDDEMRFLTAAFLRLTPGEDGCLRGTVAVGGHPPLIVVRAGGETERVGPTGPLLGILQGIEIDERPFALARADVLVLATDGVTEAGAPEDALASSGSWTSHAPAPAGPPRRSRTGSPGRARASARAPA